MKFTAFLSVIIGLMTLAPMGEARAARGTPCNSCQGCTDALGLPEARVFLADDLVHDGVGPCITIRGLSAQFDGMEREIRPMKRGDSVGVLVQAPNVLVKNLHVIGALKGVDVRESRFTTLHHLWLEDNTVGVDIGPSQNPRISRSVILGGTVGVDVGSGGDGQCSDVESKVRRTVGTVLTGNRIEKNKVGVSACSGIPYIQGNTIVNNEVGVNLQRPQMVTGKEASEGPYDSCACAPSLPGSKAGTTLFYSSGCNGCKVHEEWLPALSSQGHDIILRASGPGTQSESKIFDAHIDRCAPQVTNALGIPGCVPNYVCVANDETFKVRDDDDRMTFETQIRSQEDLAAYAITCKTDAAERFTGEKDCVRYQVVDNVMCNNTQVDIRSVDSLSRWGGFKNACAKAQSFKDKGSESCAASCEEVTPTPEKPLARAPKGLLIPPPLPPKGKGGAPAPVAAPVMDMASLVKSKDEPKGPVLSQGSEKDTENANQEEEEAPEESSEGAPIMAIVLIIAAAGAYFLSRKKS